jgi:hypothetical protein
MPKTTNRQHDKGPGKDFVNLQKNLDQAVNERADSAVDKSKRTKTNDIDNKTVADVKKAGRTKHN